MLDQLAQQLGASLSTISAGMFLFAFAGGILAGFSPCVYPMIPALIVYVTGSVPGGKEHVARGRVFTLSLLFVLGLATTMAGIGFVAGALGSALRFSRIFYYLVGAVCIAMGLQMAEVISLNLQAFSRFQPKKPKGGSFVGAYIFGLLFGLVASPCSTPALAAITSLAAAGGKGALGATLLFVYALGKGTPLLIVGTFSGALLRMRRFTAYAVTMQKVGGGLLVAFGLYFLWIA